MTLINVTSAERDESEPVGRVIPQFCVMVPGIKETTPGAATNLPHGKIWEAGWMGSVLDFLYRLTEWLREATLLPEFSLWVTDWPFALWLQENFLAIPGFQTIHILSIAAMFGSVLMLNLRVLGKVGMDQTVAETFRRYRPRTWWGLAALVTSGVILLISEPVRNMVNAVFWLKMIALFFAITVSLLFQASVARQLTTLDASPQGTATLRLGAWAVIVLWLLVMVGGRWIAYSPN